MEFFLQMNTSETLAQVLDSSVLNALKQFVREPKNWSEVVVVNQKLSELFLFLVSEFYNTKCFRISSHDTRGFHDLTGCPSIVSYQRKKKCYLRQKLARAMLFHKVRWELTYLQIQVWKKVVLDGLWYKAASKVHWNELCTKTSIRQKRW